MGGVPKRRHTKGSRNQRRMHLFIRKAGLTKCQKCGKPVLSHTVCQNCGYYKGAEVINVLEKLTKKERKKKEKELAAKEDKSAGKEKEGLSFEELSKK